MIDAQNEATITKQGMYCFAWQRGNDYLWIPDTVSASEWEAWDKAFIQAYGMVSIDQMRDGGGVVMPVRIVKA